MILQSLVQYYEALCREGKIAEQGWTELKVSFALWIDEQGKLERVTSLRRPDSDNPKKMIPQRMIVPAQVKRASGIMPNFLCDNSSYILGLDNKNNGRSRKCFEASRQYHHAMLDSIADEEKAVHAMLLFFDKWNPIEDENCMILKEFSEDIMKGSNLVFCFNGEYIHEIEAVRRIWKKKYFCDESIKQVCLITGKEEKTALLHPSIKGIKNAQSSGASLVSFNAPAFCSYGWEKGMNAQTGQYASMAYGAALNDLIDKMSYRQYLGDTAVLCYAENGNLAYRSAFDVFMMGEECSYTEKDLKVMVLHLCEGKSVIFEESRLDPEMNFCVLGIAPNAARLSVRFFHRGLFGNFIQNIYSHQRRMEMEKGSENQNSFSLWRLLSETCREGADVSSMLAGEMVRSILLDERYPSTLINALDLRIRSDHKINAARASLIKAYYMKNENQFVPKEVLTVSLNKETDNMPYNLGRLFAVLEKIQQAANPNINATIRDKFFGSASATPASVFPHLIDFSQNHLRKLNTGTRIYYEKLIGEIMGKISSNEFPRIFSMPERGAFQIGYYHQVQELYKKGSPVGEGGKENE